MAISKDKNTHNLNLLVRIFQTLVFYLKKENNFHIGLLGHPGHFHFILQGNSYEYVCVFHLYFCQQHNILIIHSGILQRSLHWKLPISTLRS